MRICIFGAGAIGGHLAARLAAAGHAVSVLARGAQLQAIREGGGLRLRVGATEVFGPLRASDSAADLGPQDLVLATVKATALAAFAAAVAPLLGADTPVVFVQNGIPWWYAQGLSPDRPAAPDLSRLDPGAALAHAVAPRRVLGAVIYTSNEVVAPGLVVNDSVGSNTLIIGEPDDSASPRIAQWRQVLAAAGVSSPSCDDIRATLWRRLLVNIAGSVVCSVIEQAIGPAQADPAIGALYQRLAAEASAIAAGHGVDVSRGTLPDGPPHAFPPQHKPSILQDWEARRPMEIEALLQAPLAFARAAGIAAPALQTLAALAAHRAMQRGLYSP